MRWLALVSFFIFLPAFQVPSITAPVMDQAGLLSASAESRINERLQALWRNGGSQIAVLTVNSLQGMPIEQASIQVADQWKLGTAKDDNGVLLLIAVEDRSLRIEVGQGLEGALTDAYARRIIDNVITPNFREEDFEAGIIAGLNAIVQHTDPSAYPLITGTTGERNRGNITYAHAPQQTSWFTRIILILAVFFLLFTRIGRTILLAFLFSSGRSRGGWRSGGGSSWGGGGFSGGGGGFSGGGASGKW